MALGDLISKARSWVQKNPDKAKQGLDKVEDVIDTKTGGKYSDKIDKASDTVSEKLGIPADATKPADTAPKAEPTEPAPAPTDAAQDPTAADAADAKPAN